MNEQLNHNGNPAHNSRENLSANPMNGDHEPASPNVANSPDSTLRNISPERETAPDPPRIYVASLADYNAGNLHGAWIEAAQEPEELQAEIRQMLAASQEEFAEEYAIHDFDNFAGLRIGEYESLEVVSALANGIAAHGEAFAAWADCVGTESAVENPELFGEAYVGHFDSLEAFGDEMWEEFGYAEALSQLPESLRRYVRVDVAMWVRDAQAEGAIDFADAAGGGVHVFWAM